MRRRELLFRKVFCNHSNVGRQFSMETLSQVAALRQVCGLMSSNSLAHMVLNENQRMLLQVCPPPMHVRRSARKSPTRKRL